MKKTLLCSLVLFSLALIGRADGPKDNLVENVRPVPPPGVAVPATDRAELEKTIAMLGKDIEFLQGELKAKPELLQLLPDVQIFHNAARYALTYNEFFKTNEIKLAKDMLKVGLDRVKQLHEGKPLWISATGLVVRGYVSKIDGSVQPYGLVIPPSYDPNGKEKHRLDFWCHGRGETLSELNFLQDRMKSQGAFTPPDTIVLHLYGRYCNANRLAGEVDMFEAYDDVRKHYRIDENRLTMRGFSMGGAACWQFGTHYAGMFAAVAPGAGFSETADFLKIYQNESLKPTWFEVKLWHMYDSIDYAANVFNTPTIAYSGENDGQKQAADMMVKAVAAEGMELPHIIGPNTKHAYEPKAKEELSRRIDAILAKGRDPMPMKVRFTTWTLHYNQMRWVTIDAMNEHWERARVDAEIKSDKSAVSVTTTNVHAFTLNFEAGQSPLNPGKGPKVMVDGQSLNAPSVAADHSMTVHFRKEGQKWAVVSSTAEAGLRKQHGLQGPIDDAFMDSFLMVSPTGTAMNDKVGKWAASEEKHAITHWRQQYRGEAPVKEDRNITDADMANHNLVLWGDPTSNKVLAKIADKLPIHWSAKGITVGGKTYAADHHVPVLIYPNPLNPKHYVVINSGFTFREYDYLNNARQTPKLPDFAVVDIDVPVSSRWPGGVVDAGFFGEKWELTAKTK